jgi:hypothetical protein
MNPSNIEHYLQTLTKLQRQAETMLNVEGQDYQCEVKSCAQALDYLLS